MGNKDKIGIIDSGLGGFTVVRELRRILPNESIAYFGDNLNCPYGNRSKEDILHLTYNMLDFLDNKHVKLVGIACNTVSTLIKEYKDRYDFPIVDIITPTVDFVSENGIDNIGILGTAFTIKTGVYQRMLLERNSNIKITTEPSPNLAALIDSGDFDSAAVKDAVRLHLSNLTKGNDVSNLILACTHYPIVEDIFRSFAPDLKIIDPAVHLARKIEEVLKDTDMLNDDNEADASIEIFTTVKSDNYRNLISKFNMQDTISINIV
jgi:glutamate racemase